MNSHVKTALFSVFVFVVLLACFAGFILLAQSGWSLFAPGGWLWYLKLYLCSVIFAFGATFVICVAEDSIDDVKSFLKVCAVALLWFIPTAGAFKCYVFDELRQAWYDRKEKTKESEADQGSEKAAID